MSCADRVPARTSNGTDDLLYAVKALSAPRSVVF